MTQNRIVEDDLLYAATARCKCGSGLAYVEDRDKRKTLGLPDAWLCSSLQLKMHEPTEELKVTKNRGFFGGGIITDSAGEEHDQSYPWASFEIKSENQPSAYGASTRPKGDDFDAGKVSE